MARLTPPKSPMVRDKHKSSCMWSLYSLFEFRDGNSSRKLLSGRKHLQRDVVDDGDVKQDDLHTKFDEERQGKDDRNENLVGLEIQHEKNLKREEASTSEPGHLPKKFQRPSHVPPYPKQVGISFDKLESAALVPKTLHKKKHAKKRRGCGCKNVDFVRYEQLNEINPQLLKVNDVTEAIVNRKFIEGKYLSQDGTNQQSKQLMDALEILNSNKELFSKLLQDPNSLLVKHIEDLRDSQVQKQKTKSSSETNILDHQTCNDRQCEEPGSTQNSMPSDRCQSKGRSDPQSSEIVVLKPGPIRLQNSAGKIKSSHSSSPQCFHSFEEDLQNDRPTYFSFDQMKRKFRRAMGVTRKDQNLMSNKGMEIIRRDSHNTIHLEKGDAEKTCFDIHRRDKINKLRVFKARIGHETASTSKSCHNISESRTYVEGKNENDQFFHKQGPKALQRRVFSPEQDLPLHSLRRDIKTGFGTSHTRFSPYSYSQVAYENHNWRLQEEHAVSYPSSLKQNLEAIIDSKKSKSQLQVFDSSSRGETDTMEMSFKHRENNATTETTDTGHSEEASSSDSSVQISTTESSDILCQEATHLLEVQSESCDTDKSSKNQNTDTTNTNEEDEYLRCSRLDSSFEDQTSTCSSDVFPSTPSRAHRVEDPDGVKDIGDQSSPISVLEQFLTDVSSPPSTISQPAEDQQNFTAIVKSHLDPDINTTTLEYVKAVVHASGLNWDELNLKSRESVQLLDPSLLDSVKFQDSQLSGECELLFDCISEVLLDVYDTHFGSSPWLSFIKPKTLQLSQVEGFVIQEVMRRVDCYFQPKSLPITLDQLIGNDLRKSGTWLDIRTDVEDMISEMVDGALDKLVMETIVDLHI